MLVTIGRIAVTIGAFASYNGQDCSYNRGVYKLQWASLQVTIAWFLYVTRRFLAAKWGYSIFTLDYLVLLWLLVLLKEWGMTHRPGFFIEQLN